MGRSSGVKRIARLLGAALPALFLLWGLCAPSSEPLAPTNLAQDVLVTSLSREAPPGGVTAATTFTINGFADVDTSKTFQPFTYTGLIMKAHQANDSVDVDVEVWVGYKGIKELGDSFTISDTGAVVTHLLLPISREAYIVFSGGSSCGNNVTIDSLFTLRQW